VQQIKVARQHSHKQNAKQE